MSGTLPATPVASIVEVGALEPARISTAHSLRRITRTRAAHRWTLDVAWPALSRADIAPLLAFLSQQKGQAEAFWYVPPVISTPQGTVGSDTPTVQIAAAIGATSISTENWTGTTTVFKAGDFVQFENHTKVYQVTADATTDVSGDVVLSIRPQLHNAISIGVMVRHSAIAFYVQIDEPTITYSVRPLPYYERLRLRLVEVLDSGIAFPDAPAAAGFSLLVSGSDALDVDAGGDDLRYV